jgi:hypothetical protein
MSILDYIRPSKSAEPPAPGSARELAARVALLTERATVQLAKEDQEAVDALRATLSASEEALARTAAREAEATAAAEEARLAPLRARFAEIAETNPRWTARIERDHMPAIIAAVETLMRETAAIEAIADETRRTWLEGVRIGETLGMGRKEAERAVGAYAEPASLRRYVTDKVREACGRSNLVNWLPFK